MGNCARRLAVGPPEQMTVSGVGASATSGETSSFHTALEECLPSGHDTALGDRSGAGSSMEPKSEYFSPRVEEMMQSKSQFSSDVEHEIEHSRVHWSEVPGLSEISEVSGLSEDNDLEEEEEEEEEEVTRENQEVFAELMNDPQWRHPEHGPFFHKWMPVWKLGQKIAEGGQAAIFEVIDMDGSVSKKYLFKVFKRGSHLSNLKKQWPHAILRREVSRCIAFVGIMLENRRFAFLMVKCWGDLRKLIDLAMRKKNNQGPPFPYAWNGETLLAKKIMRAIARDMKELHEQGVIHRDLKAANILIHEGHEGSEYTKFVVADYECSIGVFGTGFWRAPEILLALKNRNFAIDFTDKTDAYSYGMTCYEIVTGRLPFEGELEACRTSYDLVIEGQRPRLPNDLDVPLKNLIERCWNLIPHERPSFEEILGVLDAL